MGWLFSKYHSGFKVIFEISFGEWRILIRRSGYFLSIIRVLRLFLKYLKVKRDLSIGGVVFSKYHSGFKVIFVISFGKWRILIRRSGLVSKYHSSFEVIFQI